MRKVSFVFMVCWRIIKLKPWLGADPEVGVVDGSDGDGGGEKNEQIMTL